MPVSSRGVFVLLLGVSLAILHMPSGIPAPYYPLFQRMFGVGSTTISLLFATYILGVVIALVYAPKLAMRRYVLVQCCALSIIGNAVLMRPVGIGQIYLGHFIHGLVLGIVTVVVPVVLGRIDTSGLRKITGRITTSANAIGLTAGPLWSGMLLYLFPASFQLVWWIQIALTLSIMPFLVLDRDALLKGEQEPAASVLTAAVSLRAHWRTFMDHPATVAAMLTGFAAFASGGLLAALGSVLTDTVMLEPNSAIQGLVVSLCFALSAVAGAVYLRWSEINTMIFGVFWIGLGAAGIGVAILFVSLPLLLAAAAVCGVGQGFGLQGATQAVAQKSSASQAGRSVSAFFLMSYGGTICSSFGVGILISASGLVAASTLFCAAVVLTCLVTAGLLVKVNLDATIAT